ncbi:MULTISPECIES: ribose 5-phosphate isomerase B [Arthrobacter]|uniref:Ribose 5-phosphate isomerase B n=1 Tax=Arthrobacter bambusae TaxID=1338426 RepID=A0AAW8DKJ9_9MICC|nr:MULTISPECIES: ribose 5-phosphate isomerase B [Arthrobacter]MDP9907275.1 ribose 5-phosphate isomerase B [Arthrobacter bambusae]MDQ0131411.1 ribose 5-phosphate isomerase B [Arthrobacter bambusae]MDQ0182745.1 ribose 5-phosphate isomerase B [Arthrobacter bambusae]
MSKKTRIVLGADEAAFELKEKIKHHLQSEHGDELEVMDFGIFDTAPVDYPDIAEKVALAIANGEADRGILMCGTGIGMAITANKVPGIRAAQVHDHYSAERASKSNDAHIITIGARVVGVELAKSIADAWLRSEFTGGPSENKIRKISSVEQRYTGHTAEGTQ